jgi:acyl carrier protein
VDIGDIAHKPELPTSPTRTRKAKETNVSATTVTTEAVQKTITDALPQFGVDPSEITLEAKFEDLDVDSLDLAEMSQIIEEEYGVQLKGEDMAKIQTVGDVVDLVVSRAG